GSVSIETIEGKITIDSPSGRDIAAIAATTGSVTLHAGGESGSEFILNDRIETKGGSVSINTESGDITLASGIEVLGAGDITLTAPQGAIINDIPELGWLMESSMPADEYDFNRDLVWAFKNFKFNVNSDTGEIRADKLVSFEEGAYFSNGTTLRDAGGAYIQTTGGKLTLEAKDSIGGRPELDPFIGNENMEEKSFRESLEKIGLSILIDADQLTMFSADRDNVSVMAADSVEVIGSEKAGAKGGATNVMSLSGIQKITNPMDANGEDIEITTDDIVLEQSIRSAGANLSLKATDPYQKIVIGSSGADVPDSLNLNTTELQNLQNGFSTITIGSDESAHIIEIGDTTDDDDDQVIFQDPLVIKNPVVGGEIYIYDDIVGIDDASLTVYGSGHTIYVGNDENGQVNINAEYVDLKDSIKISGADSITADTYIKLGVQGANHILDGKGGTNDTLTLNANGGDVTINSTVGSDDELDGLIIADLGADGALGGVDGNADSAGAEDVIFREKLNVNGDVVIQATGDIMFENDVTITGNLVITGTSSISFASAASLNVTGDILFESNAVDFGNSGNSITGSGTLTIRATDPLYNMNIGSPSYTQEQTGDVLDISSTELSKISDGFAKIVFGHFANDSTADNLVSPDTDSHVENNQHGDVSIGMIDNTYTFKDEVYIFGNNILVTDNTTAYTSYLITQDNINLEAYSDITIKNKIVAGIDTSLKDISLYSVQGSIEQTDYTGSNTDGHTGEQEYIKAANLTVSIGSTSGDDISLANVYIDNLSLNTAGAGSVSINNIDNHINTSLSDYTKNLNINKLHQTNSSGGNITVTAENGDITIVSTANGGSGVDIDSGGNMTITANTLTDNTDKQVHVENTINVEGGDIALTSNGNININSNITNNASLGQGKIQLTSNNDSIVMADTTTISAMKTGDDSGAIIIQANDNIQLSILQADAQVELTATTGSITDILSTEDANILGDVTTQPALTITAQSGIGTDTEEIDTKVASLTATTTSGGIFIQEDDSLTITSGGITNQGAGSIVVINEAGTLTVDGKVIAEGTGNILLDAQTDLSDVILNDEVESVGGHITIIAENAITQNADGDTKTQGSGTIYVKATDANITMADGATSTNVGQNIRYEAGGSIALGLIDTRNGTTQTNWGSVSLVSGGAISDAGADDSAVDIYANTLRISAANDIGTDTNAIDTEALTLAAETSTGGRINILDLTDLTVGQVIALTVSQVGANAVVTDKLDSAALSGLTTAGNGNVAIKTTNGDLTIAQAVNANGTGNITLDANGTNSDVNVQAALTSGTGSLTITADDSIVFTADGDITTAGTGSVSITSNTDTATGDTGNVITMVDGTVIDAGASTVSITSTAANGGDISLGRIITTNATDTAASINSAAAILDAGDTGGTDIEVATGRLVIDAVSGIGSANGLETTAASLDLDNTTSNNVWIDETDQLTIVHMVQGASDQELKIIAGNTITIDPGVIVTSANGNITMDANGTGAFTMDDNSQINAGTGDISIEADGNISLGGVKTEAETETALSLTSTAGGIVDSGNTYKDIDVALGTASISAVTGVGSAGALETGVYKISIVNSTSGNIDILEDDDIIIYQAIQSAADTSIQFIAGGKVTLDLEGFASPATSYGMQVSGTGTINLDANGNASDIEINDAISSGAGAITMTADDSISFTAEGDITSTDGTVKLTAYVVDNGSDGALTMADGTVINAGAGAIDIDAKADITLGSIQTTNNTATSAVAIDTTQGGLIDAGDSAGDINIVADSTNAITTINTVTGIGSAGTLETTISILAAHNTYSGNIDIAETNAISINKLDQDGTTDPVDVTLTVEGTISIIDGQSGVTATSGTVTIDANGTTSSIAVSEDISTTGGAIIVSADDDITVDAEDTISSSGGNITITADTDIVADGASGALSINCAILDAGSGTITISSDENITLNQLKTTNDTDSAISITCTSGAIIDGGDAEGEDIIAESGKVSISAKTGIGTSANAMDTKVKDFTAVNSTSGGIFINETNAINIVSSGVATQAGDGSIVIAATAGDITSSADISANGSGNILIDADSGNLDIDSDILSSTGHITLKASSAILIGDSTATDVDITTGTAGTISIDAESGAVTMAGDSTITATDSSLRVNAATDITLGNLVAQDVSIVADTGSVIN
ncbi:MAG: hypothetical protein HN929_04110, partial [Chloroflexi bacterium]|nr:hypothetical protein [Chloroflexota bacterium]